LRMRLGAARFFSNDYHKLGVWPDPRGYVRAYNMFD